MTGPADSRAIRRSATRLLASCLVGACLFGACLLRADSAAAQGVPAGFGALPSFAWPPAADDAAGRWAGSYAALSTGYAVAASRHLGGSSGPTLGFEGGRMWQEGRFVYGISGGLDYLAAVDGGVTPGFGRLAYTRDLAGGVQVKVGMLLTPDVLVYAKTGAAAVHEMLRVGATPVSQPFARQDIAIRPDARVGVEWAVTDRLSLAVEAGVAGGGIR